MTEQDREDFILLKNDVEYIKVDVKETKENSERLNKEFDKLMFHLVGDKSTNTMGWIEKLTKFDFRLTIVERAYAIAIGFVLVMVFIKDKLF
jgi:hypothetical protein